MVPYSTEADPSGAKAGETTLPVRALMVDGLVKAWTTGEMHTVTGHTFVVEQVLHVNDDLPGELKIQWVWQRGPWLLVDRAHGSVKPIPLPDYATEVSDAVWFRNMAAYCGIKSSGRSLYAVVYRIGVRRPVLVKRLGAWSPGGSAGSDCVPAVWQRQPLSVTFQESGGSPAGFDIYGNFAVPSTAAAP